MTVTYPAGQPTGWLTASLSGTTAPATLTPAAGTVGLTAGSYTATVTVRSSVAGVPEKTVQVTFDVTKPPPPSLPTELAVFNTGGAALSLSWKDNSSNESEFRIERKNADGSWVQIGTRAANSAQDTVSFMDNTLTTQGTYTYRVRACNADGCSAYSNEASQRNGPRATTQAATNVTPTTATLNGSTVSSTGGWGSFRYGTEPDQLTRATPLVNMGSNPALAQPITGLEPNTKYYFRFHFESVEHFTAEGQIREFTTPAT